MQPADTGSPHLPLGVDMGEQLVALVCARQHYQTSILSVNRLHGSPGAHDEISRSKGEVVQVWGGGRGGGFKRSSNSSNQLHYTTPLTPDTGHIPWCRGWREDLEPGSGGLLISMVCIAIVSGPVKHSTYRSTSGREKYWLSTGSYCRDGSSDREHIWA